MRNGRAAVLAVLVAFVTLASFVPGANAAVKVTRAEMRGSDLRVEGEGARAGAGIAVDGVRRTTADDRGGFRIEIGGFTTTTCDVLVSDGTSQHTVRPSGCTPTATPPRSDTPSILSFDLRPASVVGGFGSPGGFITLSGTSPDEVLTVTSSRPDIAAVVIDKRVGSGSTIPMTSTVLDFVVDTSCITDGCVGDAPAERATITVSTPTETVTAVLTIEAASLPPPAELASLEISPANTVGGTDCCKFSFGTITLTSQNYPNGMRVNVASSAPQVAEIRDRSTWNTEPGTVVFFAPCCNNPRPLRAFFTLTTHRVDAPTDVTISVELNGRVLSAPLTLLPPDPLPTLSSLVLETSSTVGGNLVRATLTPSGAAQDKYDVALTSSNAAVAVVPATQTIAFGATSAAFFVTTSAVGQPQVATITATFNGSTVSATLTVTPPGQLAPPPDDADSVSIQRAEHDPGKRQLRVEATSSRPNATLAVLDADSGRLIGSFTGTRAELTWAPALGRITVTSSFGGAATAPVSVK